jgi:PAS domain S-box-containing protein
VPTGKPLVVGGARTDQELARLYHLQVREQTEFAMFGMSPEGRITSWNRGVEQIFGYAEEEWLGADASIIFIEEDIEDEVPLRELEAAKKNGRAGNVRWHRRKDGTRIFMRGVLNALREPDGALIGFSKVVVDDTPRKTLEDALTKSNMELEEFASAASHDLQEPLRTVSIYADLLAERYGNKLDGEATRMLRSIRDATERMSALITDLLAYSQLASGGAQATSVDLNDDWESAVALLQTSIEQQSAIVTHDPLPRVSLDRTQLVRLFQNLIANSIKFRKPGEVPHIHAWAERREDEWVIRIKDNGIGFAQEHASAIFSPFKRLHSTREYPGSGIGLAACKRIVEGWGGRIGAESKPGDGSIFWFTLPAS